MIPLRLSLRNFMCYRENVPVLSLEGVRLACLSGGNGHGKSAIIDAITWALWGKARASSDDLIHQGQAEMEVQLEFQAGSERYRVMRRRARGRETNLQLQVAAHDGWQTITGNHLRETEEKIRSLLHLDYETFINSALLLQGRADEFTTKSPAQRKDVLASILGFSAYDGWAQAAREKARERREEARALEASLETIRADVARKPQAEAELAQVSGSLRQGEGRLARQQAMVEDIGREVNALERKAERLVSLEGELAQAQGQAATWERQAAQCRQKVASLEAVLAQGEAIEEGYARLVGLRQQAEVLAEAQSQVLALQKKETALREAVVRARSHLEAEAKSLRAQQETSQSKASRRPELETELARQQQTLAALTGEDEALDVKRREVEELSQRRALLEATLARLREEMQGLKERVDLLVAPQGGARCPVCQTELGAEGIAHLRQEYESEGQARARAFRENERELKEVRQRLLSQERQVKDRESDLQRKRALFTSRISRLETELEECHRAAQEAAGLGERVVALGSALARNEYAQAEQAALKEVTEQLASIAYEPSRHEAVRRGLREAEAFQGRYQTLVEAQAHLLEERVALARAEAQVKAWHEKSLHLAEERESLSREVVVLPGLRQRLQEGEEVARSLRQEQARWQQALGSIQKELEHLLALERDQAAKESRRSAAVAEEGIYGELARAFGKEGVQALLIETALPEIEEEANRLLRRMTDNRMSLTLETQRALKSRREGVEETLDIHIADEYGTRPYELYSGGEAFRINFALRIALSKLLARRAGAPLPTLFIDEGFGTQDAAGREKLVDAVSAIQDDFEKIIVITHIDEVRDAFPVRIEVTKTAEGSTFQVI